MIAASGRKKVKDLGPTELTSGVQTENDPVLLNKNKTKDLAASIWIKQKSCSLTNLIKALH